jgi:hypothetical protein
LPVGVEFEVVMVRVDVPEADTEGGLNEHAAPAGRTEEQTRATVPVNPPDGVIVIREVVELPDVTAPGDEAEIAKSG